MRTPDALTFPEWLAAVDAACWRIAGCGRDDLPDAAYADMWADGYTAREAARAVVRATRE